MDLTWAVSSIENTWFDYELRKDYVMENLNVTDFFKQSYNFCDFVTPKERQQVEEAYGGYLPLEAWILLSLKDKSPKDNEGNPGSLRILGIDYIISASEIMQVDFLTKQLIPLVDCWDNDHLVYDFSRQIFCMFNIADETTFSDYKSLVEFIEDNDDCFA